MYIFTGTFIFFIIFFKFSVIGVNWISLCVISMVKQFEFFVLEPAKQIHFDIIVWLKFFFINVINGFPRKIIYYTTIISRIFDPTFLSEILSQIRFFKIKISTICSTIVFVIGICVFGRKISLFFIEKYNVSQYLFFDCVFLALKNLTKLMILPQLPSVATSRHL